MYITKLRYLKVILFFSSLLMFFSSCEDIFQYSPNEIVLKEDEKDLNRKNIDKILSEPAKDTLRFLFIADTHHEYEYLDEFVSIANGINDISFVIVAGDITNFGMQFEYRTTNDLLKKLKMPYVVAVGNHDLLGNGGAVFNEMFGKLDFSFNLHGNKFIFINSNSREYNFNGKVPDIDWLYNELRETNTYNKAFITGHVSPFDSDFDSNLETKYVNAINKTGKVKISMHGHSHSHYLGHYYNNGVDVLICSDVHSREYILCKVWDDGHTIETKIF